jgi:hypothetical protein
MEHPLIAKRVIMRSSASGVHIGTLKSWSSFGAELTDCQRIWSWQGALDTVTIASIGISSGRISPPTSCGVVSDARECYALSPDAEESLAAIGVWRRA